MLSYPTLKHTHTHTHKHTHTHTGTGNQQGQSHLSLDLTYHWNSPRVPTNSQAPTLSNNMPTHTHSQQQHACLQAPANSQTLQDPLAPTSSKRQPHRHPYSATALLTFAPTITCTHNCSLAPTITCTYNQHPLLLTCTHNCSLAPTISKTKLTGAFLPYNYLAKV